MNCLTKLNKNNYLSRPRNLVSKSWPVFRNGKVARFLRLVCSNLGVLVQIVHLACFIMNLLQFQYTLSVVEKTQQYSTDEKDSTKCSQNNDNCLHRESSANCTCRSGCCRSLGVNVSVHIVKVWNYNLSLRNWTLNCCCCWWISRCCWICSCFWRCLILHTYIKKKNISNDLLIQ